MHDVVETQIQHLRNAMIRDLQQAVALLTKATVEVTRDNYPRVVELTRTAAVLSSGSARTAGIIAFLD